MKISLIKGSTYVSHITAQIYHKGEVYEVSEGTGTELLKKLDDLGRPFFRRADEEEATAQEPKGNSPDPAVGEAEPATRKRGRPALNRDMSGEIDTGAVAV
jgi:hypothetical protein